MSESLELFAVMMAIMVPISLIVFITEYFKYKRSTSARFGDLKKQLNENSTDALEQELAALKERIVVLESIVTDRGYELGSKISNL
jgi:uncharacterized membrane protein YgcG